MKPAGVGVTAPLLELDHASVVRGERIALRDVSLSIPVGRHTAILGGNGCGKSTLIQLITRQLYPQAHADGRAAVRVFGQQYWDVRTLRGRLGIVTGSVHEDLARMPRLRVEDVVLGAFDAILAAPDPAQVDPSMHHAMQQAMHRAGAAHLSGRAYASLSTGEARRVMVARALVHRPAALLLDEPTTGLDPVARQRLLATMAELATAGITLVLVTHHLDEMIECIGHVVLLRDGQVLADGARTDLFNASWLSRAFGAPLQLLHPSGPDGPAYAHVAGEGRADRSLLGH